MPRFGRVASAIAIGVLAAGCGAKDNGSATGASAPWLDPTAPWMLAEGTPITAGISLPDGARLSGPILLKPGQNARDYTSQRGWLFVDGDPYAVAKAFHSQWQGEPSKAHMACEQRHEEGAGRTKRTAYTGEVSADAIAISCSIRFELREFMQYDEVEHEYLVINYTKDLSESGEPAMGFVSWLAPPIEVPESLPAAPSNVGGPDHVVSDVDYLPDLEIVDGSFLAAPAGPGSLTGGYTAWIGVSGDSDEVFDAYVAQDDDEPYFTNDRVVGGMRVRQYASSEAGGIWLYITMNEIDGNAWIVVEAYND